MWWLVGLATAGEAQLLGNGLRAQVVPVAGAPTVELAFAMATGTVDDPVGNEGLAHLAEHLWFENRVGGVAVGEWHRRLGCAANAWTADAWMVFVTSCPVGSLDELVRIESARFEPWVIDPAILAREWRVVAEEELGRSEDGWLRELTFLTRQLLPASHPSRLRNTRPPLGNPPTPEILAGFVASRLRARNAAVAVAGAVDEAHGIDLLTDTFGKATPAPTLAPLRPPIPLPATLRVAPRTVQGISRRPMVYVGWSSPPPPGQTGQAIDLLVEASLGDRFTTDPRVLGLDCARGDVDQEHTFYCALTARDDAAAAELGKAMPGAVAAISADGLAAAVTRIAEGQARLWQITLGQRRGAEFGALATVVARSLLDGTWVPGKDVDLDRYLREARLAESGLVLVLPASTPVPTKVPRPAPVDVVLGPLGDAQLPEPGEPLSVSSRTLPNGLRLVAVRRPDATLQHAVVRAWTLGDAASVHAAYGGSEGSAYAFRPDVLELDAGRGPDLRRTLASYSGAGEYLAALIRDGLEVADYDPVRFEQRALAAEQGWALATRSASWWSAALPRLALRPDAVRAGLEAVRAALPEEVTRALPTLYSPERTTVVVVGPAAVDVTLTQFEAALGPWAVPARAAPPPPKTVDVPRAAFVPVPGVQAKVGARCGLGVAGGKAAVAAALVSERLRRELRERRAISYSPGAFADAEELLAFVTTDPATAAEALAAIKAALTAPDLPALHRAQVQALGPDSPTHLAPEALAEALADGTLDAASVAGWEEAVRTTTVDDLAGMFDRCRPDLAWAIGGPEGTVVPEGTARLDAGELGRRLQP